MSDPQTLVDRLDAAEDSFGHVGGRPEFEPKLNAAPDAAPGEVQIQKACRLLALSATLDELGEYYGAMLEHSFIAIEHTFQGYLLAIREPTNTTFGTTRGRTNWRKDRSRSRTRRSTDWNGCTTLAERNTTCGSERVPPFP